MKFFKPALPVCLALALAACGGGDDLSIDLPGGSEETLELDFPPGEAVEHRLPFRVSGGVRPYEASIEGCPDWVTMLPDQGILAGTAPESERGRTFFCAYRVSDAGGLLAPQSVSYGLRIAVGSLAPVLALPRPSKIELSVGTYHGAALPAATGGVAPRTYSFTCAGGVLPPGTGFAPATRMFAGTPEARFRDSCTYTVTDSSRPAETVSVAVEIEVSGAAMEPLTLPNPGRIDLVVGTYHGAALPATKGGVAPYIYSFTCAGGALPSGTGFAPATRMFAGTPEARFRDSCIYTVTDGSRPAETVSVAVEVEVSGAATEPLTLPGPGRIDLVVGTYHGAALPAATGGVMPYIYSFTCAGGALPSGTGFAPATRVYAGTPQARFRDSCTYTVTDSSRPAETVSVAVEVEVSGATEPLTLPRPGKIDLVVGTYHGAALPAATGGVAPYIYSFTCVGGALPSGTGFAAATRTFAGTPEARFRDSCTYTVTDSSRPAATVSEAVEVEVSSAATEPLALPDVVVEYGDPASLTIGQRVDVKFKEATGGVRPYTHELLCALPQGLGFSPDTRILSGTPLEAYRGPDCTYRATDSDSPPVSVSRDIALTVDPLDRGTWRFRTRTVEPGGPCTLPRPGARTPVATLPHAHGGVVGEDVYDLLDRPHTPLLEFNRITRQLTYFHPPAVPIFGTPNTYRYVVGRRNGNGEVNEKNADDVLCLDIQFDPGTDICSGDPEADPPRRPSHFVHIHLRVRDDAYWDTERREYRCPDTTAPAPQSAARNVSNPVHTALAPVHARRAVDVAHAAVRDRVRRWSPGAPRLLSAITPAAGIGSLSGRSEGFDYSGSSQSLSGGVEMGAGSWQAGLVASFARTELDYRAEANLSGRGYRDGEHDTEIFSVHPFAAWHVPSGGKLWASLGGGGGDLRYRDDLGFPSWSGSDVRLRAYAVGGSVPFADVLSGELQAEAGIDAFALEIEGGGRISSSLPTLRGRDYRAGLAWIASVPSAPSLSVAYRRLTGDGPEGARLESRGSVSFAGVLHPRLSVTGSAEASYGLGGHEHDSWRLGGGVRFAPEIFERGFGLDIDTGLVSTTDGRSSAVVVRGEAGYGLRGGALFRTVRPYAGLMRRSGEDAVRRSLGVDIGGTPGTPFKLEVYDNSADRSRGIALTWRRRF